MEKRKEKKSNNGHSESLLEDYGDYVTRCICDFQHDDGYMICCDDCGVWQHIECMQVDTKNLPENYLCELCDPRPVDRKRARQAQIKKREDLSDLDDDDDDSPPPPGRKGIPPTTPASSMGGGVKKKQRRRGKSTETKPEPINKSTKVKKGDIPPSASIKKAKKKPLVGKGGQTPGGGGGGGGSRVSNIQSLLNAASILDGVGGGAESSPSGGRSKEHHRSTDIWNANLSPWSDKYDTIDHNRYSEPIRTFVSSHLSQLKSEAVVYSHDEYLTWDQRSQPQCSVAEVGRRRRGLTANANIPEDELVLEYMGKITVKQSVINDVAPESKLLWRHKPCPFVYCYDKISGVDMCIDARSSGTIARFMRRSCSPNSEIRHFFVSNELHFGVYALVNIAEGEEITLPFDFKFDKCEYMMECACGQPWTMCLVARAPKRHVTSAISSSSSSSSTKPNTASEHQTRAPSRQQSLTIISSAGDEDSNSSWTSSSGRKRSRHHHHGGGAGSGSGHGPLSPGSKSSHHHGHHPHHQASLEGTSESEEESAKEKEKRRKSLSREERKTEQIWKLVEKMEASQQRKQRQQLLSEGSLESDPLSSPSHSQNMTSHLFTSYKATPTSAGGKERKSSNNSRKTPLYPGSKMRLSSVSSTDALSPCDLSEAFSPPFTPGLATGPDAALTPSHVHPSPAPLLSPPPTISSHKPTFVVTPDLHPKYLFADFALPYKKAFLKQWEDEQRNRSSHAHPYWSNGHTYHLTEDRMRKRVRGSLKHRWLKQHREERERELAPDSGGGRVRDGDDKENLLHSPAPLSHKKLMLLRWENSVLEKTKTSLPLSPPLSPHPSHPHQPPTSSKEEEEEERQPIKRHSSPLFEELSDEEFEEARKTADSADGDKDTHGPKTPPIPTSMDLEGAGDGEGGRGGDDVIMDQSTGADDSHKLTDDNLSSVSDTSLASCSGDEGVGPRTPPVEPNEPSSSLVNVGDISSGLDGEQALKSSQEDAPGNQAEKGGGDGAGAQPEERDIGGISANKSETGGEVPGNQPPTATAMEETSAAASEDVLKSADSAELNGSDTVAMESTTNVLPGDDVPHPLLSDTASQQESAPPSPSAVGTPTKTPGKRKINLSEYRNRARKPMERKAGPEKGSPPQSSSSSSSTTSLLSTPSFLSQGSIASRILSSPSLSSYPPPLKLSSTPGAGGSLTASPLSSSSAAAAGLLGVPGGSGHSQFEPVSPDEDEKPASEDPSGGAASAGSVVGSLHLQQQQQQQLLSMSSVSYPHTQSILGPGDRAVMLGPGAAYLQQAPPTGVIAQPPPLVHMVQGGGVLQTPPPPPPPGGQYAMWPPSSGAPVGEQAIDPRKGLIPIPGHAVAPQQQHTGLFPVHGGPLIQPGILQQQPILGPGGRGEFHHHGYVGHPPPPPGAPVYRPRPPGPGGNYY